MSVLGISAGWMLVPCLLLTLGCQSTDSTQAPGKSQVVSAASPGSALRRGSSFAFLGGDKTFGNGPEADFVERALARAVASEMNARGFRGSSEDEADLLIGSIAAKTDSLDPKQVMRRFGMFLEDGAWAGAAPSGTLLFLLIDGPTKRVLWRATAQAPVRQELPAQERSARLARHVNKLFANFPVPRD